MYSILMPRAFTIVFVAIIMSMKDRRGRFVFSNRTVSVWSCLNFFQALSNVVAFGPL